METGFEYYAFISYRHDGGDATAILIAEKLRNAGYNVFLMLKQCGRANLTSNCTM